MNIGIEGSGKLLAPLEADWLGMVARKRYGTLGTNGKGNKYETIV